MFTHLKKSLDVLVWTQVYLWYHHTDYGLVPLVSTLTTAFFPRVSTLTTTLSPVSAHWLWPFPRASTLTTALSPSSVCWPRPCLSRQYADQDLVSHVSTLTLSPSSVCLPRPCLPRHYADQDHVSHVSMLIKTLCPASAHWPQADLSRQHTSRHANQALKRQTTVIAFLPDVIGAPFTECITWNITFYARKTVEATAGRCIKCSGVWRLNGRISYVTITCLWLQ